VLLLYWWNERSRGGKEAWLLLLLLLLLIYDGFINQGHDLILVFVSLFFTIRLPGPARTRFAQP
jgi:hypothetical protein